ncbi:hypothetical protein L1987_51673 [Smallanthus sonchifolius]|uniref:Uncharacterized protein n=1 Tax=Smallanthus sonchifolius TaxID=185202 RepID=A0ACB9ES39_9ASTR|nr:hypothetical protein L1987_51673 [Smallanthus sonchifolius]
MEFDIDPGAPFHPLRSSQIHVANASVSLSLFSPIRRPPTVSNSGNFIISSSNNSTSFTSVGGKRYPLISSFLVSRF